MQKWIGTVRWLVGVGCDFLVGGQLGWMQFIDIKETEYGLRMAFSEPENCADFVN